MTKVKFPELEDGWLRLLAPEFEQPYFTELKANIVNAGQREPVYPAGSRIFAAFNLTPLQDVKVVILGQDPYHGPGQAHGLSFSVPPGLKLPPSLKNIYKEIEEDLGLAMPGHGNLENWARQGVLLLNATLTVSHKRAGSHQGWGWETFTDKAIQLLAQEKERLVFMLWGRFAQKKRSLISAQQHLILEAPHPSPFSAYKGFLGCRHFSKANQYLQKHSKTPVNWQLPEM